jgi:hypothetical protein
MATDWNGKGTTMNGTLLNYDCFQRHKSVKACGASPTTSRFMLFNEVNEVNGKQIRFDRATNDRTRMAMEARADRPRRTTRTPVYASATGSFRSSGRFRADVLRVK